jgi:WD40 repeat protein
VSHIAFSPDGATLATGGRQKVLLWDIATGRLLLELPANDTVVGLEFSRDGERLAIAANDGRGNPAGLMVYDILERRGLQLLRGLAAPVIQVRFSSDGEYVTALSSDWQLAVWDAATGHLRRVLRVPRGLTADNAGFAVSPDGEQIAFATSRYAALRDIASGRVEREWKLKPGLQEQLAFHQSGRLLLVHVEARSGSPFGQRDRETDPLVCRIYDLFAGGDEPAPIAPDVTDFGRHVGALVFSPDGERFAVDGYYGPGAQDRAVACFATLSGNRLWSLPSEHTNRHGTSLFIDPTGAVVSVVLDDTIDRSELLDALTGKSIGHLPGHDKGSVGPGGWYALNKAEYGCHLLGRGAAVPLAKLGVDSASSSYVASFNAAGTHVAWGNADGTVTLSDIALLRRRLTSLSLDWADALAGGK